MLGDRSQGISRRRIRAGACFGGALALVAIAVPSASATPTRFGSDVSLTADGTLLPCTGGSPCELVARFEHPGNTWPDTSPISGVVTQFLVRSSAEDTVTLGLAHESPPLSGQWTAAATGPEVNLDGANDLQMVPARIPVAAGDSVAMTDPTSPTFAAVACAGSTGALTQFHPPLAPGELRGGTGANGCELLLQGIAEPDADGDVFGDDTQDSCPGSAGPNNGCPGPAASAAAQAATAFDRAAALKACKRKKSKKARKKCIKRVQQHA
jgi:hypothetical protein